MYIADVTAMKLMMYPNIPEVKTETETESEVEIDERPSTMMLILIPYQLHYKR